MSDSESPHPAVITLFVIGVIALIVFIVLLVKSMTSVDPGNVGVVKVFGRIEPDTLSPGFHMINPFSTVTEFNCKDQTFQEEGMPVPAADELVTNIDVSVQYSFNPAHAVESFQQTGDEAQLIHVHLEPKMRSALREAGKSVKESEDFFKSDVQVALQTRLRDELSAYLAPKGIIVSDVLLRNIQLPAVVVAAVQAKKQREQATLTQQAELARFTVEQQQKVAIATAELDAAKQQALQVKVLADGEAAKVRALADAQAYQIEAINKAMSSNPAYVQLQALEALKAMAKDPATKLYFINGDSRTPLPLLHLGDAVTGGGK